MRDPATAPVFSPPPALSRERIAVAALALIDAEGVEGCSMRRLGAELGVEAMALYHHFKSKGALLDAVMDLLTDDIDRPALSGAPLRRVEHYMRDFRGVAVRHPRAFILLAARRFNTDRAFASYERVLALFGELGLQPEAQAYWWRLIGGFACGAGMAYAASVEKVADATRLVLEHTPQDIAYPRVRAVAPYLQVGNLDTAFEFGLGVLMKALAQALADPPSQAPAAAG